MTDGVTEAARFQKERTDLFVDYRAGMRGWMVRQLETWALSSYLTEKEARHARRLASLIEEEHERRGHGTPCRGEEQVPEEGGPRPSTRKGKARSATKSPKRA